MLTGTLTEAERSRFSEFLCGAIIEHVERRADNVIAICVRASDGGLSEFVLNGYVPYKGSAGVRVMESMIHKPRDGR